MRAETSIAKKRILFVDDDPSILAGLQNLLYKDRRRWEMVFAANGDAALDKVRAQSFDVVVSDMRMPGMDGATLLNRIRDMSPRTARIMLSGHAEREAIVRALPALHQLLAKPCDGPTLRATIERSLATEATLRDDRVRAVIGRLDQLPSPPEVCTQVAAALASPATTLDELAAVVTSDPGLSAKVLQLVNSAYFGSGQRTSSIRNAVAMLGADQLRYIGSTAAVFGAPGADPFPEMSLSAHRDHGVRSAAALARIAKGACSEEAYAAALLHDIGCIVFAQGFPEEYRAIVTASEADAPSFVERERAAFGADHAEVGAYLLSLWGLPAPIVEIVRYHTRPGDAPEEYRALAAALHVAEAMSEDHPRPVDLASLEAAGCASQVPIWRRLVEEQP